MNESPEYRVEWGKIARTIVYHDADGQVVFGLDGSRNGAHWITLEHHAPQTPRPANYAVAFDRVKCFLESCGFQVEVYGEAPEGKVSFGRDMQTLLYEDSQGKLIFYYDVISNKTSSSENSTMHFIRGGIFAENAQIIECKTQEERERFAAGLKKVEQYLVSHGYKIQ